MAPADKPEARAAWGRVLVIMPTYNELESLGPTARHLLATVAAVDLLVAEMEEQPADTPRHVIFQPELVVRASTAAG